MDMNISHSKLTIDDLYDFENDEKLLRYCFSDTGIPMWMFLRDFLFSQSKRIIFGNNNVMIRKKDKVDNEKPIFNRYLKRNPFLTHTKYVVFAFFPDEQLSLHKDGCYDELIMPYIQLLKKRSTTIMSGKTIETQTFQCSHTNWKSDRCFYDIAYLKKNKEICREDRENIEGILNYIFKFYPISIDNKTKVQIKNRLYYISLYHKKMINICNIYLRIVKPKLVIISHGSYQIPFNSAMILACRKRKIITAEFQHAWVGKNHPNFYYGDLVVKNEKCKAILPDYLLTMGSFWNSQVNVPQNTFLIGYAKNMEKSITPQNDNILFLASEQYEQYETILDDMLPMLNNNTKLYFRFHPTEITPYLVKKFNKYAKHSYFCMANEYSVGYYMEKCRYVIVDGSTVCYEALYAGRIVFCLHNSMSKLYGIDEIGGINVFETAEEFMNLWNRRNEFKAVRHKEFYEKDWKRNFMIFLMMQGIRIK